GLRYAIARGLHEVEARPFDSIVEFAAALRRFEQGDRRTVVAQLVRRVVPEARPLAALAPVAVPSHAAQAAEPRTARLVLASAPDAAPADVTDVTPILFAGR